VNLRRNSHGRPPFRAASAHEKGAAAVSINSNRQDGLGERGQTQGGYRMAPRLVLIALLSAFGIASAAAMVTTIRQMETANYTLPQPVTRI
jgi:hypothetical protein